jgi:hypothetical protein
MLFLGNARGTLLTLGRNVAPARVEREGRVSVQQVAGPAGVALLDQRGRLQLYTLRALTAPDGFPLYEYTLLQYAPLAHVLVTSLAIYVVPARKPSQLLVLSRQLAARRRADSFDDAVLAQYEFGTAIHALYRVGDDVGDQHDARQTQLDDELDADAIIEQLLNAVTSPLDNDDHDDNHNNDNNDEQVYPIDDSQSDDGIVSNDDAPSSANLRSSTIEFDYAASLRFGVLVVLADSTA